MEQSFDQKNIKGIKKIVADTSVIIDGRITEKFSKLKRLEVIIPYAVVQELEHQSNVGKSTGDEGLEELSRIQNSKNFLLKFIGEKLEPRDIKI